jgi:DNA invertase Pin-like site-specific DNA recombinase
MSRTPKNGCVIYLRVSQDRNGEGTEAFPAKERAARARAAQRGWPVVDVVREVASAWKRRRVTLPDGSTVLKVKRPEWDTRVIPRLAAGLNLITEDLDRTLRDNGDCEDLLNAVEAGRSSADSVKGTLKLTRGGTSDERLMARLLTTMANKASADTARRVADGRARVAELGSYGGGPRPFGYMVDPAGQHYHRTLIPVPAERDAIRQAADALLTGVSLKEIARRWRTAGLKPVKAKQWSPKLVRDVMLKPALAGIVIHTGTDPETGETAVTEHTALWARHAILAPEKWQALRDKLTDPARQTNQANPGHEPVYLLSGIAHCYCGAPVKVTGGAGRSRSYVCTEHGHLRRTQAPVDALVTERVIARLNREPQLLLPPARDTSNAPALRTERQQLRERLERVTTRWALGEMDDFEQRTASKSIKARLDAISTELAAVTGPDQLAEFRDVPDAAVAWDRLSVARRRAVVRLLYDVTLLRATRRGAGFNPASVKVEPVTGEDQLAA